MWSAPHRMLNFEGVTGTVLTIQPPGPGGLDVSGRSIIRVISTTSIAIEFCGVSLPDHTSDLGAIKTNMPDAWQHLFI